MEYGIEESPLSKKEGFKFFTNRQQLAKKRRGYILVIKVFLGEIAVMMVEKDDTIIVIGKGFRDTEQAVEWQKYVIIERTPFNM